MPRQRSGRIAASPQATSRPAGIPACLLAAIGRPHPLDPQRRHRGRRPQPRLRHHQPRRPARRRARSNPLSPLSVSSSAYGAAHCVIILTPGPCTMFRSGQPRPSGRRAMMVLPPVAPPRPLAVSAWLAQQIPLANYEHCGEAGLLSTRRSPAWSRDTPAPALSSRPPRPPNGPGHARSCCGRWPPTSSADHSWRA